MRGTVNMLWTMLITNTIKWLLIPFTIMGFPFRKSKENTFFLIFIYAMIIYLNLYTSNYVIILNILLPFFIIYWGYKTTLFQTIKIYVIELLSLFFIDQVIILSIITFFPLNSSNSDKMQTLVQLLSSILFLFCAFCFWKKRDKINQFMTALKRKEFILISVGLGSFIIILYSIRSISTGEIIENSKIIAFSGIIFCIFFFTFVSLFFHINESHKQLKQLNQLNERCLEFQKDYYESIIHFDEEMRAFRHDVNKHYQVLAELLKKKCYDDARQYLMNFAKMKDVHYVYKTGNIITDYIVNGKIAAIQADMDVDISVMGLISNDTKIEPTDLCIIMDNALDNAKEALEQYEGKKELKIIIKNFNNTLYFTFINSSSFVDVTNLKTSKSDTLNHGYGLTNIKRVVEKNHGLVTTSYHSDKFYLEIELQQR